LAAAGDAVQQERLEATLLKGRLEGLPGSLLILVERDGACWRGWLLDRLREAVDAARRAAGQSLDDQRLDRARATADQPRQLLQFDLFADLAQLLKDLALPRRQFRFGLLQ